MKPIRFITVLFFIFILLIIIAADTGILPKILTMLYVFPNGDKAGHFFLLGIMAFLLNLSMEGKTIGLGSLKIPLGSLLVASLATIEEISQSFFPARSASLEDLFFSYLGIVVFTVLSVIVLKRIGKRVSG